MMNFNLMKILVSYVFMNTKLQFKSFEPYFQKVQILGCYITIAMNHTSETYETLP
jgi:hypothetical protein